MKDQFSTFLATLLIIIAASVAVYLILTFAKGTTLQTTVGGSEAKYAPLQQSILNQ